MNSNMAMAERRRERRISAEDLIRVEELGDEGFGLDALGRTRDLSHDGMCVELDHHLTVGTRVLLDLALGDSILRLHGWVRSARPSTRGSRFDAAPRGEVVEWGVGPAGGRPVERRTWEMGIELEGVTPEQYEALDLYLHLRGD